MDKNAQSQDEIAKDENFNSSEESEEDNLLLRQQSMLRNISRQESWIRPESMSNQKRLTVLETTFTLVASTVGGEIVAVPYAIYHMGIYLASFSIISIAIISHVSNMMYLRVKDLVPLQSESIFELAYNLYGKWALYLVCAVQYLLNFAQIVLYYALIGDTISQVITQLYFKGDDVKTTAEVEQLLKAESFGTKVLTNRALPIMVVGLALFSIIFMRQLRELRILAYTTMVIMVIFISLFVGELFTKGGNVALSYADVSDVKFDNRLITSFSIIFFIFIVQFQVFPSYTELRKRSNQRFARASIASVAIETFVYFIVGFTAILMFGPADIKPSILDNLTMRPGALSIAIRVVLCLLLVLYTPFLFFATKEQSLVLHEEIVNQSLARRTEFMLEYVKNKEENGQSTRYIDQNRFALAADAVSVRTTGTTYQPFYKLSDSAFFWHAIVLHLLCLATALFVSDITVLFDLIGAITSSFSMLFFPAAGYLAAAKRYGERADDWATRSYKPTAWLFIVLGVLIVLLSIYQQVLRIMGKVPKEESAVDTNESQPEA